MHVYLEHLEGGSGFCLEGGRDTDTPFTLIRQHLRSEEDIQVGHVSHPSDVYSLRYQG